MSFEKEFDVLMATFKKELFDTFEEEFTEIAKSAMTNAVEDVVYKQYEPKQYKRRRTDDGGLQNEKSITPEFVRGNTEVKAKVRNKAVGVKDLRGQYIDSAIVDGSMFPKGFFGKGKTLKRPFYDDPQKGVMRNIERSEKELQKRIEEQMKKNGWGVK